MYKDLTTREQRMSRFVSGAQSEKFAFYGLILFLVAYFITGISNV